MQLLRHHRAKRHLASYVDAELDAGRLVLVRSHLEECPDCTAHVRLLLSVKHSLRSRQDGAVDPHAVERLRGWAGDL